MKDENGYLPMSAQIANEIAIRQDMLLPTPELVDEIYRQAECKAVTKPKNPADLSNIKKQSDEAEAQLKDCPKTALAAGHYKNIVISGNQFGLYGWYTRNGDRIQPFFAGHSFDYVDYSHGLRLVYKKSLDMSTGKLVDTANILYN